MSLNALTRRKADADTFARPDSQDRVRHLKREAQTIFDRTAVCVGAMIGLVLEKLLDEITVGSMDFDTVKTGFLGVLRRRHVIADNRLDLFDCQGMRLGEVVKTAGDECLPLAWMADGATGAAPFGCNDTCEMRPTCQSWMKILPLAS